MEENLHLIGASAWEQAGTNTQLQADGRDNICVTIVTYLVGVPLEKRQLEKGTHTRWKEVNVTVPRHWFPAYFLQSNVPQHPLLRPQGLETCCRRLPSQTEGLPFLSLSTLTMAGEKTFLSLTRKREILLLCSTYIAPSIFKALHGYYL